MKEYIDSDLAQEIVQKRRVQPEVQSWIKRFKRLANEMPEGVWVFVGAGSAYVMGLHDDGGHFMTQAGSVDQNSVVASIIGGVWDGGDW